MRMRLRLFFAGSNEPFRKYPLIAAGHRVVHGGSVYTGPVRIDESVIAELRRLIPLAPLHQPHHLAAIAALSKLHPTLPQIACFDTSFHHTQPEVASIFALPRRLTEEGVRRYGFHGLSYEYIASVLPDVMGPAAAEDARGRCSSRQWRQHVRDAQPQKRRNDHGLHRARWPADGPALRQSRSGCRSLPHGGKGHDGAGDQQSALSRVGIARRLGHQQRHANLACKRRSSRQERRSIFSSTASAGNWARSPPRSAGSMRWSSPRASASTPRKSGGGCASKRHGSVLRSTKPPTPRAAPGSRPAAARRPRGLFQPMKI